jgi:hypothetical protein
VCGACGGACGMMRAKFRDEFERRPEAMTPERMPKMKAV